MARILDFDLSRREPTERAPFVGPATIVIFPGVRYERGIEPVENLAGDKPPSTPVLPGRRRN